MNKTPAWMGFAWVMCFSVLSALGAPPAQSAGTCERAQETPLRSRWFAPEKTETQEEFTARLTPLFEEASELLPNLPKWEKRDLYALAYAKNGKEGVTSFRPEKLSYSEAEKETLSQRLDEKLGLVQKYRQVFGFLHPRTRNDLLRDLVSLFSAYFELHDLDYEVQYLGRGMISLKLLPGARTSEFQRLLHTLDQDFKGLRLVFNPWTTEASRAAAYFEAGNVVYLSGRILRQFDAGNILFRHELRHATNALFPTEKTILGYTTGQLEILYPNTYNDFFPHDEVDTYTLQLGLFLEELEQALGSADPVRIAAAQDQLVFTVMNGLTVSRRLIWVGERFEKVEPSRYVFSADERGQVIATVEAEAKTSIPLIGSASPQSESNRALVQAQLRRYREKGRDFEAQFLMVRPWLDQLEDCADLPERLRIVQELRSWVRSGSQILEN